jgi:HD-like signal output (HDOD) protein/signal transduction histidine kinase
MTVAQQQKRSTRETLQRLPALPQILLKLLDAISHDMVDVQQLAQIIRQDSAMTARLVAIANSSLYNPHRYCNTVERAVMCLGLETVRTLILTAAFKQHFSHFDQQHYKFMQNYWLRSLSFAQSSQVLAKLTRYHSPAEAYLSGLLADVGQLCLLTENPAGFLAIHLTNSDDQNSDEHILIQREQSEFCITHCEFGAELIDSWQMGDFMSDAVRYHHEPVTEITQAHHLVKIVNLASDFSRSDKLEPTTLLKAHNLFGLNEELAAELHQHIQSDVMKMAQALDLQQNHNQVQLRLGGMLEDINQVQTISQNLPRRGSVGSAAPQGAANDPLAVTMLLGFGIEQFLIFTHNSTKQSLEAFKYPDAECPDFDISDNDSRSLLVQAFQQDEVLDSSALDAESLCILDKQLIRHCRQQHVLFMPYQTASSRGVVAAGASPAMLEQQRQKSRYWQILLNTAARSLVAESLPGDIEHRIRETIHEVSNPLSVINNYLEVLRIRYGSDKATARELSILSEEIDRIGGILLKLKSPDSAPAEATTDINRIVSDQVSIFRHSMCATRGIEVKLRCDPALENIRMDQAALKQILTNLIKNAIESLPEGGLLTVSTEAKVFVNARPCVAVTIEDTGPGIDKQIMANMFEPTRSTKGKGHSGLGLSVVKQLMDSMKAEIICSSNASGTQFKLMFPIQKEQA